MLEMYLRRPGFTYTAYRPFVKNKERKQKFEETGGSRYIYQIKPDKAYFQHDMAYSVYKNLPRRASSDQVLCDKAFAITQNPYYGGYQHEAALMVDKSFDKYSQDTTAHT